MAHTISVANMANAVVKSCQEMGSLVLRAKNSKSSTSKVMLKQKHQLNMHHTQKEIELCPSEATRLKEMQVVITASIRTMPTGTVSVVKSSVTMLIGILWSVYSFSGSCFN